ncbi:MAG: hypothetical protein ABJI96_16795 [Paracoccaceae bacterium]
MTGRRWHSSDPTAKTGRGITALYVLAAFGGGAAIVALRWTEYSAVVTACAGSGVVVLYALAAMPFKPRAMSTGPIGDNCYYLGFIFTLTSLAWSLYSVGEGKEDDAGLVLEIVSGFGIALLTTAVGVVMRVALNTPRVDMIEEEQAAFQSIRHYYDLMHRDLSGLSNTNKQFALGIRLSLEEFRTAFVNDLRTEADTRREAIREVVKNAEQRLLDRLAALEARASRRLEVAGQELEATADACVTQAVTAVQEAAETRVAASVEALEIKLADAAKAGKGATQELTSSLTELSAATEKLADAAVSTGERIDTTDRTASEHLDALTAILDNLAARENDFTKRLNVLSDQIARFEHDARHKRDERPGFLLRLFRR